MLGWYQEDYADFVKECKDDLQSIKTKNDISPEVRDILIKLAKNQAIIAEYMATQAGVDDGY